MFSKFIINPIFEAITNFSSNNAFCINEQFYSYEQFAQYISKIRTAIQSVHLKNTNISLVVNDDIETYASIFAIWLEGFAYVPLHPQQPVERSLEIISQAEIELVLDSSLKTAFTDISVIETTSLCFESLNLDPKMVSDETLAYILFTSGSTGKPKGVMISRKNAGAFMKSFGETGFQITENDRCLQCFDLTFDVSVQSYLVPLTKGACTYTIPHDQIKYSYVYGLLEDHQLTFGAMAPSMIRYLRPYFDEINIPSMRYSILTAEASPVDLINEWANCIPNAEIFDFYGPTEATIYCTYHKYIRKGNNKQLNGMLSIGKAMPGLKAIIIDDERKSLDVNQKGELCISGDQVTPGYWKNTEKNKESFFEMEIDGIANRFYKTGDSCYFDTDGDIMLAGRLDYQVKIQGYRIELGEIEYHAREFLTGQNAVAVAFNNQMGNTEIALFVEGILNNEPELLVHLNSKMPFYMIPTKIMAGNLFPINTSGKVDRIKLKNQLT
ncbi:MAG: AMP-binding protein [Bacteroidales bacterium]|nr:AMP-binding protein [Bacteroidales bacterium]